MFSTLFSTVSSAASAIQKTVTNIVSPSLPPPLSKIESLCWAIVGYFAGEEESKLEYGRIRSKDGTYITSYAGPTEKVHHQVALKRTIEFFDNYLNEKHMEFKNKYDAFIQLVLGIQGSQGRPPKELKDYFKNTWNKAVEKDSAINIQQNLRNLTETYRNFNLEGTLLILNELKKRLVHCQANNPNNEREIEIKKLKEAINLSQELLLMTLEPFAQLYQFDLAVRDQRDLDNRNVTDEADKVYDNDKLQFDLCKGAKECNDGECKCPKALVRVRDLKNFRVIQKLTDNDLLNILKLNEVNSVKSNKDTADLTDADIFENFFEATGSKNRESFSLPENPVPESPHVEDFLTEDNEPAFPPESTPMGSPPRLR